MTTKNKMMIRPEVDRSDVQAIAWTAFGSLKGASYVLLRVIEPHGTRQWLRGLAPASLHDLSVADVKKNVEGVKKNGGETYQIAFTAAGLLALGIDETIVKRFSPEFVEGMASNENRSRRLGDTCACRKLNPGILVMQPAQDWATKNVPGAIDGARDRCILLQG